MLVLAFWLCSLVTSIDPMNYIFTRIVQNRILHRTLCIEQKCLVYSHLLPTGPYIRICYFKTKINFVGTATLCTKYYLRFCWECKVIP